MTRHSAESSSDAPDSGGLAGVPWLDVPGLVALAGLAHAGTFKAIGAVADLPIDLTFGLAAVVTVSVAGRAGVRWRAKTRLALIGLFFGAMAPAATAVGSSLYASEKVLHFFTLTFLATVAPIFLIRSRRHVLLFLVMISALGILVALLALVGGERTQFTDRLILAPSGNPIAVGRSAGLALLPTLVLGLFGSRLRTLALVGVAVLAVATVLSLSQGPVLAASLGVVLVVLGGQGLRREVAWRSTAAILSLGLVGVVGLSRLTSEQGRAISQAGAAERERLELWRFVAAEAPSSPLGRGLGSFLSEAGFDVEYPHNLLLEVAYEAGWFALGTIVLLLTCAMIDANAARRIDLLGLATSACLAFVVTNAMVSGDVNGNRVLFIFIGTSFAIRRLPRRFLSADAGKEPQRPVSSMRDSNPAGRVRDMGHLN